MNIFNICGFALLLLTPGCNEKVVTEVHDIEAIVGDVEKLREDATAAPAVTMDTTATPIS
jgi:hypothetical protein